MFELLHVLVDFILCPRPVERAAVQRVVEGAFEGVRVSFEIANDLANIGANHRSTLGARIRRERQHRQSQEQMNNSSHHRLSPRLKSRKLFILRSMYGDLGHASTISESG